MNEKPRQICLTCNKRGKGYHFCETWTETELMHCNRWEPIDHVGEADCQCEKDPHGIGQHDPGAKLDSGKILAGVLSDFSYALQAVAEVGTFGANKYSRGGWQSVPDGVTRYSDALWRHLLAERHESLDQDSGLLHAAHLAWNALSRLELKIREVKCQE